MSAYLITTLVLLAIGIVTTFDEYKPPSEAAKGLAFLMRLAMAGWTIYLLRALP